MNRYGLWQYLIIAVSLLLGLLYTLPNFYGESPAIQISPLRISTSSDTALLQRVEETLKQADLEMNGILLEEGSIKVRFADTDLQMKAKDLLESVLGNEYIIALNLLPNSPQWLTNLGALPMYLGLDLRGGVHFMLAVDMEGALEKSLDRYSIDIRSTLREKKISYTGLEKQAKKLIIKFRDVESRSKAEAELKSNFADFALSTEEADNRYHLIAEIKPEVQIRMQDSAVMQNITTLRNRVNELGVAEPIIQKAGADRVIVQLPGVQDTAKAKDILGRTATLEVRMVDDEHDLDAALRGRIPAGTELHQERGGSPILVKKQVLLTGERITDAQPGFDKDNQPAVHVSLDNNGSRIFKQLTRENVGRRMAILLIEKNTAEVVTAPVIREEIGGGRVQISGRMTSLEARDVALLLRAGALAAPMDIIEERTVGPSLGADNITRGFNSTLYGFIAVAIFIAAYYTAFGVISVIALAFNLLLLVGLLSIMQATLTLPGMAALALTVGMAIDANVLINERIRDELRAGASPQLAIHSGYERAFGTILDSNITTLIAGIALFAFGSGPVKGFAVVLCLGIMTSVFTAIFVSRGMVNFMYGSLRKLDNIPIGITWVPEPSLVTGKSDLLSENEITKTTGSTEPKRSEQTKESSIKPDIVSQTSVINEDESVVEDSAKARAIAKNKAKSKRKSADTKKTKQ
ncbi:MAG: protein translocase subunit SecD [Nitrosomonas sp.]|uniref:protein translocase subunit SecD n=1 Tax=Nitrosomonas sp. TaxID=42353 RepID=UPI0025E44005|nr:protein translocase subunit SecD [Nitrosomonas sp.]MBY0474238.1 protein translocase subunit SecD [Nitrosomonas sp.]